MKGAIVLVLMATAISLVHGFSLFDDKSAAIEAINNKHSEAKSLLTKIENDINNEKNKKDENSLKQTQSTLQKKEKEAGEQLDKNSLEVTRTAIAKGKPLQAIECIASTLNEGKRIITDSNENSKIAIENVLGNKLKKLDFLEVERQLMGKGLDELIQQALKKIDGMKDGYAAVVADASKKVDSASKQLHELEKNVPLPLLVGEYGKVKQSIESKFKEISDNLLKRLQKCVA